MQDELHESNRNEEQERAELESMRERGIPYYGPADRMAQTDRVLSAIEVLAQALRDDRFGGDYNEELSLAARLEEMAGYYREKIGVSPPGGQQTPYAHDGQEYIVILWDWKAEVPLEDIYQAVGRGFVYGGWVPNVPTDDKVVIASRTAEFDAQAVYDAFEADPDVWG